MTHPIHVLSSHPLCQVEIDDYRDYEKAIGALREALKYLGKAETRQASDMAEMTERRIDLMEQFVKARKALQVRAGRECGSSGEIVEE